MRPKPMVEIGGRPILWHIMKIYAAHGIEEFVICLGYKGYVIKEYFANYYLHTCDVSFDLASGDMEIHRSSDRAVARDARRHRRGDDDRRAPEARADVPGRGGLLLHLRRRRGRRRHHGARSPFTARRARWRPSPRCSRRGGSARSTSTASACASFEEKPRGDGGWINGGFFVLSPGVGRYIDGDDDHVGAGADGRAGARRPARGLPPRGLLAADGHAARPQPAGGALWRSRATPWRIWRWTGIDPGFWRGRRVLRDRPYRLQGRLAVAVAAVARRAGDAASRAACPTEPSLYRAGARRARASTSVAGDVRDAAAVARGGRGGAARGRDPHGGAVARAPLLREPARDLRDERDGHRQRARGRAPARRGSARGRQRHLRQVLREREWEWGLPRGRADGRPRPVLELEGLRGARRPAPFAARSSRTRGRAWPRRGPAT